MHNTLTPIPTRGIGMLVAVALRHRAEAPLTTAALA
jgi:hypothetical protein